MILINRRIIEVESLPDILDEDGSQLWNRSIRLAIEEWFNDESFVMMHTSGSTGIPKPIRLLKTDIKASAKLTYRTFDLGKDDNLLCCLPLNYIAGRMMLYRGLVGGLNVDLIEPSANPIKALKYPVSFAALTPLQWEQAILETPEQLKLINTLIIGGAPIPQRLENMASQSNIKTFATYGMTETLTHIAIRPIGIKDYFEALQGVHFTINLKGCLRIHNTHLMDSVHDTTDLIELINSTRFRWLGRSDRIINVGGIKVNPETIERKLNGHINAPFFVIGIPDQIAGHRPALVIEGSQHTEMEMAKLNKLINRLFQRYQRPIRIYYVPNFVLSHTGKVDQLTTLARILG